MGRGSLVADVVENIRLLEVAGMDINQTPCVTIGVLLPAMVKLKKHSLEGRKTTNIQITKLIIYKKKIILKIFLVWKKNVVSVSFHFSCRGFHSLNKN